METGIECSPLSRQKRVHARSASFPGGYGNRRNPPRQSPLRKSLFSGMAVLILTTVFLGFARSYYLAGLFKAPLPNLIIHIHGAVFSSWILLLIAQTWLVAAGRVDLHRRLGLLGFALACLVVILGDPPHYIRGGVVSSLRSNGRALTGFALH